MTASPSPSMVSLSDRGQSVVTGCPRRLFLRCMPLFRVPTTTCLFIAPFTTAKHLPSRIADPQTSILPLSILFFIITTEIFASSFVFDCTLGGYRLRTCPLSLG
ncbi:hypothetical protein DFJ73DRAFT_805982, partial [Zopfochytrium polystomum]